VKTKLIILLLFFSNCLLTDFSFAQKISGGGLHSIALCSDSTVMAWGNNVNGQLGIGDTSEKHTPVQVHGPGNVGFLTGITMITTGGNPLDGVSHSLALKNDGTVWAWGWNHYGQLGNGDTISRYVPEQVIGLTGITSIAGGGYHSFALKNDGTVWTWGRNIHGQLGVGDIIDRNTPVQVSGLTGIIAIAGGGWGHSIALKNDGTVWSWGQNYFGQLGLGDTTDRLLPAQVSGLSGIIAIANGGGHSLALKNDSTVWVWGYNSLGQLGDSTTTDRHSPVQMNLISSVFSISGGAGHSLALKNNGTAWTWGYNQLGELGDGTTTDRKYPVQVSGLTDCNSISGGGGHSLALKNDGTVWAWGFNDFGEIGDGSVIQRNTPVLVSGLCYVNNTVELSDKIFVKVFPTPFSTQATFTFNLELKNSSLKVYDVFGKEVKSINFSGYEVTLKKENLHSGIYFYQIISENKTLANGKLMVE